MNKDIIKGKSGCIFNLRSGGCKQEKEDETEESRIFHKGEETLEGPDWYWFMSRAHPSPHER